MYIVSYSRSIKLCTLCLLTVPASSDDHIFESCPQLFGWYHCGDECQHLQEQHDRLEQCRRAHSREQSHHPAYTEKEQTMFNNLRLDMVLYLYIWIIFRGKKVKITQSFNEKISDQTKILSISHKWSQYQNV